MNKKVKWGIIIFIGAGLIGWGIYSQLPKENKELAAADKVMSSNRNGKKALNVNAKIIKPQLLKDEIKISGSLLPDEEVDLSFETSGKIIEIVGLSKYINNKYSTYSLGTKQKLGIAQAIMENPDLIILDEPFNGRDE